MSDVNVQAVSAGEQRLLLPRLIWRIIRASGLVRCTVAFVVLFLVSALLVYVAEPHIDRFMDAAWLMFQVVTTIGLGDFTCTTVVGRGATIALSLYSVFFIALITGAVVSFCTERMRLHRDASIAHFIDQLERLPELSHDELVELSDKVKRFDPYRAGKTD